MRPYCPGANKELNWTQLEIPNFGLRGARSRPLTILDPQMMMI